MKFIFTHKPKVGWLALLKAAAVSAVVGWPLLAKAGYWELAPGGVLAAGTSYSDPRLFWIGGLRLTCGLLALFTLIKAIRGYFGTLTHGGSLEAEEGAFTELKDSATMLVLAIVGAALAPYAVNVFFNLMSQGGIGQLVG